MLQGEHSAILSTFIKEPFVIKIFVLSIFEWPFYTGFTEHCFFLINGSVHEIFVPIAFLIDEGSDEPAQMRNLVWAFPA